MLEFFARDWQGAPFELFGPPHVIGLVIILAFNLWIIFGWKNPSVQTRHIFRYALAFLLVADELMWHWWNWYVGSWSIQYTLPLHVCSIMVWLSAYMLITENYFLYDFIYFMGIGAATQALLTPDAGIYGFPHFRFFQAMFSHGMIVTTAVYLTVIEGFRPTWKSLGKVVVGMNVYLVLIMCVNAILGSNYLFVAHKPETPTLIDLMPPWPWYILILEAMGLAISLILYIPFAIKDWRVKKIETPNVASL